MFGSVVFAKLLDTGEFAEEWSDTGNAGMDVCVHDGKECQRFDVTPEY